MPGSDCSHHRNGASIRQNRTGGALEKNVLTSVRTRILDHSAKYCHPWSLARDKTLWHTTTQVLLTSYGRRCVYTAVADCQFCAAQCTRTRHQKRLRLFPTTGPLEILAMNILGSLSKTKSDDQCVNILPDQYTKLTKAIQPPQYHRQALRWYSSKHGSTLEEYLCTYWLMPDGNPSWIYICCHNCLLVNQTPDNICL